MAESTTVRETERKYPGEPVDADLAGALARAAAEAMHGCAGPPREPAEFALPRPRDRVVLERDRTDHLVAELRWLAGQLGGARDLEVQEQQIGAAVSALPPELAMGRLLPRSPGSSPVVALTPPGPRMRPWTVTATSRCWTRSTRCWPIRR